MFCWSLFVPLYCFFWPLRCLFFFDIRILIAPLVSSNSSLKCELFDGNVTSHICQRCYLIEGLLLTRKLLDQWFLLVKLNSSLQKFYGMEYLCHKCPWIWSTCRKHFPVLSSFMAYHRVCNWINKTGVTSRVGTAYPFWTPELTPGFVLLDL